MKKVSIIVPVYNCEKYLPDCMKAIINQTYKNIEVILIDDESTDNSGKLCDDYGKKYTFVKVVHQKNAGPGFSRNIGLEECEGEYFTFVDADDYISSNMIELMVKKIELYNADIVEVGNVNLYPAKNTFHSCDNKEIIFKRNQDWKKIFCELRFTIWGKLYRKQTLGDIRFSNKRMGEDCEYVNNILELCQVIVKYNVCLYAYRAYQDSIIRGGYNKKSFQDLERINKEIVVCRGQAKEQNIQLYENKLKDLLEMIKFRGEEIYYKKSLEEVFSCYRTIIKENNGKNNQKLEKIISEIERNIACSYKVFIFHRIKHNFSIICGKLKVITKYQYKI